MAEFLSQRAARCDPDLHAATRAMLIPGWIAAQSDGDVAQSEIAAIVTFVDVVAGIFDARLVAAGSDTLLAMSREILDDLAAEGEQALFDWSKAQLGEQEQRLCAMQLACIAAAADGSVDADEMAVLVPMAKGMGIGDTMLQTLLGTAQTFRTGGTPGLVH